MKWTEDQIAAAAKSWLKSHNGRERSQITGSTAVEFVERCMAMGLNPQYDGVVAYASRNRLVFIVEHDTYCQIAASAGGLLGISSGTRVREDGAVIAFARVRRKIGDDVGVFEAELDVKQWQLAHCDPQAGTGSPFWRTRSQSMSEKCVRVMAVKLAYANELHGLRDEVTSVLYDEDGDKPKRTKKTPRKPPPSPEPVAKPSENSTLQRLAESRGHEWGEFCARFGADTGEVSPEMAALMSSLLHGKNHLATAEEYQAAKEGIIGIIEKAGTEQATLALRRFGGVSKIAYLTGAKAREFAVHASTFSQVED